MSKSKKKECKKVYKSKLALFLSGYEVSILKMICAAILPIIGPIFLLPASLAYDLITQFIALKRLSDEEKQIGYLYKDTYDKENLWYVNDGLHFKALSRDYVKSIESIKSEEGQNGSYGHHYVHYDVKYTSIDGKHHKMQIKASPENEKTDIELCDFSKWWGDELYVEPYPEKNPLIQILAFLFIKLPLAGCLIGFLYYICPFCR